MKSSHRRDRAGRRQHGSETLGLGAHEREDLGAAVPRQPAARRRIGDEDVPDPRHEAVDRVGEVLHGTALGQDSAAARTQIATPKLAVPVSITRTGTGASSAASAAERTVPEIAPPR